MCKKISTLAGVEPEFQKTLAADVPVEPSKQVNEYDCKIHILKLIY